MEGVSIAEPSATIPRPLEPQVQTAEELTESSAPAAPLSVAQGETSAPTAPSTAAQEETDENTDAAVVQIRNASSSSRPTNATSSTEDTEGLTEAEKQELGKLKIRDREVRAHEQAHLAALGQYRRGGAQFTFTTGPDGKAYATSGEVPVDVSKEGTPEKTIQKAQTIRRAAQAPAQPSSADRAVAAKASSMEAQARKELAEEEKTEGTSAQPGKTGNNVSIDNEKKDSSPDAAPTKASKAGIATFRSNTFASCPLCSGNANDGHSHVKLSA